MQRHGLDGRRVDVTNLRFREKLANENVHCHISRNFFSSNSITSWPTWVKRMGMFYVRESFSTQENFSFAHEKCSGVENGARVSWNSLCILRHTVKLHPLSLVWVIEITANLSQLRTVLHNVEWVFLLTLLLGKLINGKLYSLVYFTLQSNAWW